ncbi:hypothetical protein Tco_0250114 [Tanacetum coccineum]
MDQRSSIRTSSWKSIHASSNKTTACHTVSIVEPKNIKEAMADSAWIEAMQDDLHQFARLNLLAWKQFGFLLPGMMNYQTS